MGTDRIDMWSEAVLELRVEEAIGMGFTLIKATDHSLPMVVKPNGQALVS